MPIYKNMTTGILKFRANKDGVKGRYSLKPQEEIELDDGVALGGLIITEKTRRVITKKSKGDE